MKDKAIVEFFNSETNQTFELEIPLNITANDLIVAINDIYHLDMDIDNIFFCYLIAENPIAFIRGSKELREFGIHNGTKIIYKRS